MQREGSTATSSKNSVNCFSGARISTGSGTTSRPGASESTTKRLSVARPVASSSPVRVTTRIWAASSTPEM
jgi:hypothetical protein